MVQLTILFIALVLTTISYQDATPVSQPSANPDPIPRPISFSKLASMVPLAGSIASLYSELKPKGSWLQASWVETHLVSLWPYCNHLEHWSYLTLSTPWVSNLWTSKPYSYTMLLLLFFYYSSVHGFQEIVLNHSQPNLPVEQQVCQKGYIILGNYKINIKNIHNKTFCPPNSTHFGRNNHVLTTKSPIWSTQIYPAVSNTEYISPQVSQTNFSGITPL